MSELITKLNPALVVEAMQAPAIIYENDYKEQLPSICKSHTYDPSTKIGVILLNDSEIPREMFLNSPVRKVQLFNITSIEYRAFYRCSSLVSVNIPDSVTEIGDYAFAGCTLLKEVVIPDSVTRIRNEVFYGCTSLTRITIPDSVTEIGRGVCCNCPSLENITIGNGVTAIGDRAFEGCDSLTSVTIGNSVSEIGQDAFLGCTGKLIVNCNLPFASFPDSNFSHVVISNGVTSIEHSAFSDCRSLTSVTIPDSVTEIEHSAFEGCSSLTSVTIPNGITEIGNYTFRECTSLKSITIPNGVTEIGYKAFYDCTSLKEVYCKPTTPPSGDENMFSYYDSGYKPLGCKIYVPLNSVEAYKTSPYWSEYADQIVGVVFEDEALESGTNIKTINGNSILGSGDITIESDGNVYTWSVPTDVTQGTVITGTVTPEEYAAIKEASQVYIEMEGAYYQALKMNADKYGSLVLSAPIILNDSTGTHTATGLCFEIISDLTFSGSVFMVNIPTKTSQLTNDANFVTYANFEWDGSSEGTVTQEKFEELRNANIVIVKQQDGDIIAHACKTSGGAVIFYYSTTMDNIISSAMFIVRNHDCSWTCSTSQTTIPAAVTEATVSGWGFTKNAGTVTGVKINGNTQNPSNGVVDLGYVNKQLSISTLSSMTLSPNIYYRNANTSLSSLTITLGSVSNSKILNEYFVEFTTCSSGTTISLPSSIKWANGVTPTFENGKTYQISIVNNLGTCVKFG